MEDDQGTVFIVGEVTEDLVPGLRYLAGARDNEIDLASGVVFSRHGVHDWIDIDKPLSDGLMAAFQIRNLFMHRNTVRLHTSCGWVNLCV